MNPGHLTLSEKWKMLGNLRQVSFITIFRMKTKLTHAVEKEEEKLQDCYLKKKKKRESCT